eukprot:5750-Eustigmatos_ZCMA.PRE.1
MPSSSAGNAPWSTYKAAGRCSLCVWVCSFTHTHAINGRIAELARRTYLTRARPREGHGRRKSDVTSIVPCGVAYRGGCVQSCQAKRVR